MDGITLSIALFMVIIILLPNLTQAQTDPFELIFTTDSQTELTGSTLLQCRDTTTAEPLKINQTKFWLNRTSACDSDLTARADVHVVIVDNNRIKFNLTRNLEGDYTCGRLALQENGIIVKESTPKRLICKFSFIQYIFFCTVIIINAMCMHAINRHNYYCIPHVQHSKPPSQCPDLFIKPSPQGLVTLLSSLAQPHREHRCSLTQ